MIVQDIKTYKRNALINVTAEVREAVRKSGVAEGAVTVYCPHTTAGMTINENADPDVCTDLLAALEALVPRISFRHAEGNSDAHLKASVVGASVVVPVSKGEPVLGIWQGIYFCEFDGPRNRKFYISVNGK
jgi:secondary thiamine-phosphate synthase enzyme